MTTPILDAIKREIQIIRQEGKTPHWFRVTQPVWNTIRLEAAQPESVTVFPMGLNYDDSVFGIPVHRYPTGSIDSPCWQLMTTPREPSDAS